MWAPRYAEKGFTVSCIDLSPVGLEKAAARAQSRSVTLQTTVFGLKTANAYDAIISIFCHLPPHIQKHVHRQVHRGLLMGGVFILEGYSQRQINDNAG